MPDRDDRAGARPNCRIQVLQTLSLETETLASLASSSFDRPSQHHAARICPSVRSCSAFAGSTMDMMLAAGESCLASAANGAGPERVRLGTLRRLRGYTVVEWSITDAGMEALADVEATAQSRRL